MRVRIYFLNIVWTCQTHCLTFLQTATGYEIENLTELILHIHQIHVDAQELQQQAIQEKYRSSKYYQVSNIIPKPLDQYKLDDLISAVSVDILNTTDENIESVRKAFQLVN